MYLIFDIGGSGTKVAVFDKQRKNFVRHKNPRCPDGESFMAMLRSETEHAQARFPIRGIAFSSPGTVDPESGKVGGISALDYIHEIHFSRLLADYSGLPVCIENDAKCAALGELAYGKTGCRDFAMVVVGTGIGGALVADGQLRRGARREAGEFGQMLLTAESGEAGYFSRLGTLPNLATRLGAEHPRWRNSYHLFEDAQAGIEPAASAVDEMFHILLRGLHNLRYIFDPECFFIGGAVSRSAPYMEWLQRKAAEEPFAADRMKILPASFGNDNNLLGALSLIIRKSEEIV